MMNRVEEYIFKIVKNDCLNVAMLKLSKYQMFNVYISPFLMSLNVALLRHFATLCTLNVHVKTLYYKHFVHYDTLTYTAKNIFFCTFMKCTEFKDYSKLHIFNPVNQ